MRLDGKVALVTGAARGIGAETARLFASEGASLAVLDTDGAGAERIAEAILTAQPGARVIARELDIARETMVAAAVGAAAAELGRIDILVNNAAAREIGPIAETSAAAWQRIVEVNLVGTTAMCRAALPHLRASGAGSIVNVSSAYALAGRESWGLYDATKAALIALTRTLACEEARHGVRANAVCPGSILTPWTEGRAEARGMTDEELRAKGMAPSLLGRWGEAGEVARPILWLASDEASFITGAVLAVDGGLTAI